MRSQLVWKRRCAGSRIYICSVLGCCGVKYKFCVMGRNPFPAQSSFIFTHLDVYTLCICIYSYTAHTPSVQRPTESLLYLYIEERALNSRERVKGWMAARQPQNPHHGLLGGCDAFPLLIPAVRFEFACAIRWCVCVYMYIGAVTRGSARAARWLHYYY